MRLIKREGIDTIYPYDLYRIEGCIRTLVHRPINYSIFILPLTFISCFILKISTVLGFSIYHILLILGTIMRVKFYHGETADYKVTVIPLFIVGWLMKLPFEALYITPLLWHWKRGGAIFDLIVDIIFIGGVLKLRFDGLV